MGWLWGSVLALLLAGQEASSLQSQQPERLLLDWVHAKGGWVGAQFTLSFLSRNAYTVFSLPLFPLASVNPVTHG